MFDILLNIKTLNLREITSTSDGYVREVYSLPKSSEHNRMSQATGIILA